MTSPAFTGVISVASPCKAKWEEMKGDDQVRFCGACEKNVYSLGSMTTEEVRELFIKKEGKVCWRFYTRADGTVLTKDCPVGIARLRQRTAAGLATVGALFFGAIAGYFGPGSPLGAPAQKFADTLRNQPQPQVLKADPRMKRETQQFGGAGMNTY